MSYDAVPPGRTVPQPPVVPYAGPFTRSQARADGISDFRLATWVGERRLLKLFNGVYVDAGLELDLPLRARAISLVAPPEAVVVDRTAAWLHGLDIQRRSSVHEAPPVDMYLAKDSRIRRAGVDSGRRELLTRDLTEVHGVRVTTHVRTALDLARGLWRYDGLGALDQYLARGVRREVLIAEIARFKGYRGVRQARMLIPLADPLSESMAESALRLHWHDAMLPWPEPQHWVLDGDVPRYRLDLADPRTRYCAEYDGEQFHSSDAARQHDARRRQWCRDEHGWHIDVFTRRSVYGLDPHPVDVLGAGWSRARQARRGR